MNAVNEGGRSDWRPNVKPNPTSLMSPRYQIRKVLSATAVSRSATTNSQRHSKNHEQNNASKFRMTFTSLPRAMDFELL